MATEAPENEQELDAYALLSKPTLELTDSQVALIVADLRQRRKNYIATGKPDKPKKEKVVREKASAADKAANTALLLAGLNLKMPGEQ